MTRISLRCIRFFDQSRRASAGFAVRHAVRLAVICSAGAIASSASANDVVNDVLAELAGVKGVDATFAEERISGFLTTGIESKGTIEWRSPDSLTKHTESPFDETIAVSGESISIKRVDDGRVRGSTVSMQEHPELRSIVDSVRATLAGDRSALESLFAVSASGSLTQWTLELKPVTEQIAAAIEVIRVSGADNRIGSFHVTEKDGDESTMTLSYSKAW